jgi:hypothetical protein
VILLLQETNLLTEKALGEEITRKLDENMYQLKTMTEISGSFRPRRSTPTISKWCFCWLDCYLYLFSLWYSKECPRAGLGVI